MYYIRMSKRNTSKLYDLLKKRAETLTAMNVSGREEILRRRRQEAEIRQKQLSDKMIIEKEYLPADVQLKGLRLAQAISPIIRAEIAKVAGLKNVNFSTIKKVRSSILDNVEALTNDTRETLRNDLHELLAAVGARPDPYPRRAEDAANVQEIIDMLAPLTSLHERRKAMQLGARVGFEDKKHYRRNELEEKSKNVVQYTARRYGLDDTKEKEEMIKDIIEHEERMSIHITTMPNVSDVRREALSKLSTKNLKDMAKLLGLSTNKTHKGLVDAIMQLEAGQLSGLKIRIDDLNRLRVNDIRAMASKLGLDPTKPKKELIEDIVAYEQGRLAPLYPPVAKTPLSRLGKQLRKMTDKELFDLHVANNGGEIYPLGIVPAGSVPGITRANLIKRLVNIYQGKHVPDIPVSSWYEAFLRTFKFDQLKAMYKTKIGKHYPIGEKGANREDLIFRLFVIGQGKPEPAYPWAEDSDASEGPDVEAAEEGMAVAAEAAAEAADAAVEAPSTPPASTGSHFPVSPLIPELSPVESVLRGLKALNIVAPAEFATLSEERQRSMFKHLTGITVPAEVEIDKLIEEYRIKFIEEVRAQLTALGQDPNMYGSGAKRTRQRLVAFLKTQSKKKKKVKGSGAKKELNPEAQAWKELCMEVMKVYKIPYGEAMKKASELKKQRQAQKGGCGGCKGKGYKTAVMPKGSLPGW